MAFTEDSRVKIPTILHLTRMGYQYLSKKHIVWDEETNIITEIFKDSISKINDQIDADDCDRIFNQINASLGDEDLGEGFFNKLISTSGIKLIDFKNFENNSFHVVTELTCKNGDDEFRPDITLFINGMPLVFIEVKKPNNREGVLAERERIKVRSRNKKFRKFINITQLMIFSNNMEYNDDSPEPIEGSFYASSSYENPVFNYFREEEHGLDLQLLAEDEEIENFVLKDNNLEAIKSTPEFLTNKSPDRSTNRLCTSLLSKERISFLLQYGLVYVNEKGGKQKHVMRYPQMFATRSVKATLGQGIKKGIIWHTQGSGKTALAYFNVKYLTDYFLEQSQVPKFYFIVDRIDLLKQAKKEFISRGLIVHTIQTREDFVKDIKKNTAIHNDQGKPEITVINIQKFQEDPSVTSANDYSIDIQRIYFLDEVHRSYNPKGSFLANLTQSDPNSIKIGLTGTPLLGEEYSSRDLFGDYIHKYYYNQSIADGYTLRLIREDIESSYKIKLQEALEEVEVQIGDIEKRTLYSHPKFVEPLLNYIVKDLNESRKTFNDDSIGGMVICDSADQAREMNKIFSSKHTNNTAQLILHDEGSKDDIDDWVDKFKSGEIDLLFVYNMLLTGFDAHRLKKLYLGRVVRSHNLLQALTRVNRPYNEFQYGYVVDFADISEEFDATNKRYFDELQNELGDELDSYDTLFKSSDEIEREIEEIKDVLFAYNTENAEEFSRQIGEIEDREVILGLKKALVNAKSLYNVIRLQGNYEFIESLDFEKLNLLLKETSNHLDLINLRISLANSTDSSNLLNIALEDVIFTFIKIDESELVLSDEYRNILSLTREEMRRNFDQADPVFATLYEELRRLFKMKDLKDIAQGEMKENVKTLDKMHERAKEINRKNALLHSRYREDAKYVRIHKRLLEKENFSLSERKLMEKLSRLKFNTDDQVLSNSQILDNQAYFKRLVQPLVIKEFKEENSNLNSEDLNYINNLLINEYTKDLNQSTLISL